MPRPETLRDIGPNLFAAAVLALLIVPYAISMAAFVFSGPYLPYLPAGAGMLLIGTCVAAVTIALGSSVPGVIATPKGNVCAILALMGAAIAARTDPSRGFATLAAAGLLSTLLTGILLTVLGWLRLGNLFRFVPYPVVGGYFAGAGFLLVRGAFPLLTGLPLDPAAAADLLAADRLLRWVPAAIFAAVLFGADRRLKHPLVIPVFLFGGIGLFYLLLAASRMPLDAAREAGLLMPDFAARRLWPPIGPLLAGEIDPPALLAQGGGMLTIVFLSAISALLITSAIEIGTETDLDLDRDLRTAGIGNVLASLCGGLVCFHTATDTVLARKLGARRRTVGLVYALLCGLVVLAGPRVITFLPIPVMGGIILFQGADLLADWAVASRRRLPPPDYLLVLVILAVVVFFGFVRGVAIGILIAAVLFVVNYSRMAVVKHALDGARHRSRVLRPEAEQRRLSEEGHRIYILTLQGYIFFGTADRLLHRVRDRIGDPVAGAPGFVLFDFRQVSNIDTSAVNSFVRMRQLAAARGVTLVFAGLRTDILRQLQLVDFFRPGDPTVKLLRDLDHALEWCEDQLLGTTADAEAPARALGRLFGAIFGRRARAAVFLRYLRRRDFTARERIFRQGDEADALYFVHSGKITLLLELEGGDYIRLQTLGGGTVFGEMGLYTRRPRSATAVARRSGALFCLSRRGFARLQREHPDVAARLHLYLGRSLAERLALSNDALQSLSD